MGSHESWVVTRLACKVIESREEPDFQRKIRNVLIRSCLDMTGSRSANDRLPRLSSRCSSGKIVARRTMRIGVSRRTLAVMMSHALRWQIAVVHSLCAVLARCATIFVYTLGLAFATAHTGAARPKGSRANNRRHDLRYGVCGG